MKGLFQKNDDSHEFKPILVEIEERPANPLGRAILWLIIGSIIFFGCWLYMGKIDIVVTARGKIIPDGETKVVQPLEAGVIRSIQVKPGDFVEKGEVLVEIDPSTTAPALESALKNLNHLSIETERLSSLLENRPFLPVPDTYGLGLVNVQKEIFTATKAALDRLIEGREKEVRKIEKQISAHESERRKTQVLLQRCREREARLETVADIIPLDNLETVKNEIVSHEKNLESIDFKLGELDYQKRQQYDEIAYQKENFRDTTLKEMAEKRRQLGEVQAEIDRIRFMNRKQTIVSPTTGYVNELHVHTVGGVVSPAQKLLSIVPADIPLIVESIVFNKDIGFVEEKMPVSVKVDAFDFQKYGMLSGRVKQISRDSIVDEQLGPVYKIYVVPEQTSLRVEGREASICAGMTVTSEVNVGKRRIIEFFIYPLIKYLDEGMSVR